MKKIWMGLILVGLMAGSAWAEEALTMDSNGPLITIQGILIDTDSYFAKEQIGDDENNVKGPGKNDLNSGVPAGVLVGNKVYILIFPSKAFANDVGQTVEIKGDLHNDNLIQPQKAFLVRKNGKKAISLKTLSSPRKLTPGMEVQ